MGLAAGGNLAATATAGEPDAQAGQERAQRPADGSTMGWRDALDEAEPYLGRYDERLGGYASDDGTRRVRMTDADLGGHGLEPHLGPEERRVVTDPRTRRDVFVPNRNGNSHIFLEGD